MAKSNKSILEHILSYCDEIKATIDRFGDNVEIFINDIDYRKSVLLSILQIGELAGNLSDDYRSSTSEIPWKQIRGLRNIVAHSYGTVDFEEIFDIAHDNISDLKVFCEKELKHTELLNQEGQETEWSDDEDCQEP